MRKLIYKLYENKNLSDDELYYLISERGEEDYLFSLVRKSFIKTKYSYVDSLKSPISVKTTAIIAE